jgi:2-amino-4-hydroxy-6-hydroxymethyldihydropteridine diphosphokinase
MSSGNEAFPLKHDAEAIVALGTNVAFGGLAGAALLAGAGEALASHGLNVRRRSSFWLSPAWPNRADPPFVNACLAIEAWAEGPDSLMALLHKVEAAFGRVRERRNAPRTLDLDLIAWADLRLEGKRGLQIPHPRLVGRAFVLAPLAEIAPGWRHPVTGERVQALLAAAPDHAALQRIGPWDKGSV